MHAATSMTLDVDDSSEIVTPAVQGTLSLLTSTLDEGFVHTSVWRPRNQANWAFSKNVKRFFFTSPIAAIFGIHTIEIQVIHTEDD